MILDSSALVAVILREPGCEAVLAHLETAGALGVGAPTLSETAIVLAARLGRDPRPKIARLLQEYQVTVVPFTMAHWVESTEAFLAYGKGRHRAALNYSTASPTRWPSSPARRCWPRVTTSRAPTWT